MVELAGGPRTRLVGFKVQVSWPVATEDGRVTVPVNPLTGATMIVKVAGTPARVVTLVGLAVTVKSETVKVAVVEWDMPPLVPVIVSV